MTVVYIVLMELYLVRRFRKVKVVVTLVAARLTVKKSLHLTKKGQPYLGMDTVTSDQ